tara:strand:- start:2150 stop:2917 length:768 start_codon:yes stop_codon:yes gene_type:complete
MNIKPRNYTDDFFKRITHYSQYSSTVIIEIILEKLNSYKINSVLDVGCGSGYWLKGWHEKGIENIVGIDGDYLSKASLVINQKNFKTHDLKKPLSLNLSYDFVQSLEVAEHLPKSSAETFISSLTTHGKIILFSAAVPGQGGTHHINEQPLSFWYKLFKKKNYIAFDLIRPFIQDNKKISFWYRYNTLLYVHESLYSQLKITLDPFKINSINDIKDYSPLYFKVLKLIIRYLPCYFVTQLSYLKIYFLLKFKRTK